MWVSKITEENLTNDMVDRLLFEGLHDFGEKVDCVLVLGSNKAVKYRVPVGVHVYLEGRTKKVMMCGGIDSKMPEETISEAERMKKKAIELGVAEEDIIVEDESQNTVENILCAMVELQRAMWLNNVRSVLVVTTAYHMRRSLHLAKYLFPAHINVYACPADDTSTRRDNWMNTEVGTKRVREEALNIVRCIQNGVFPDFEI